MKTVQTKYFELSPEVAGGWGPGTIVDNSVFPPDVKYLEYCFDGWLGDHLVESFPCFIVTKQLRDAMQKQQLTGASFEEMLVSTSEVFDDTMPGTQLPEFVRLVVTGKRKQNDLWLSAEHKLVVSERLLGLLTQYGLSHAEPIAVA